MNRPTTRLKAKYLYLNQQYHHWLQRFNLDSPTLVMSLAGFMITGFLTWLLIDHHQKQQDELVDTYGNALNQVATEQLKVLMSNNNLIGLQSTLNDLIEQAKVVNAVVYGVDNKILVQAGDANRLHTMSYKAYTSPITLDDALLGSLTINIDNGGKGNYGLVAALLALVASLLLYLLYRITKSKTPLQTSPPSSDTPAEKDESRQEPVVTTVIEPNHQALLLIRFHTLDKIYQQLNAEARQKEFEKNQRTIKKVLALYRGEQVAATPDTLLICFEEKDKKDCLLNALYCAYLLLKASQQQQWLMSFSSFIYDKEDCEGIVDCSQLKSLCQEYNENIIAIKNKTIEEYELAEQLTCSTATNTDYAQINGFSNNYEELLQKQLQHIS